MIKIAFSQLGPSHRGEGLRFVHVSYSCTRLLNISKIQHLNIPSHCAMLKISRPWPKGQLGWSGIHWLHGRGKHYLYFKKSRMPLAGLVYFWWILTTVRVTKMSCENGSQVLKNPNVKSIQSSRHGIHRFPNILVCTMCTMQLTSHKIFPWCKSSLKHSINLFQCYGTQY